MSPNPNPMTAPSDVLGAPERHPNTLGLVYTFYSYKGGVGRSMALANVAAWLAEQGKKVLVLDWDLEAPGLERFFSHPSLRLSRSRENTPGIVDLVLAHQNNQTLTWRDCTIDVEPEDGNSYGRLSLVTAGVLASNGQGDYITRLRSLNWDKSFELGFGNQIDDWRSEWTRDYDFVLIDSRTGISDVQGICTILLPDVVVLVFTTSAQSVDGIADVMRRSRAAQSKLPLSRSRLVALPLLTRDERKEESAMAQQWINRIAEKLGEFYSDWLPADVAPADVLLKLYIPSIAKWSFGEPLPVLDSVDRRDPGSIVPAFVRLARLIDSQLDWKTIDLEKQLEAAKRQQQVLAKREQEAKMALESARQRAEEERQARQRLEKELSALKASSETPKTLPENDDKIRRRSYSRKIILAAIFAIGVAVAVLVIYFLWNPSKTSTIASLRGRAYENRQNNRIPDAIKELTQALNLKPDDADMEELYGNRAYCYKLIGNWTSSISDLTSALATQPLEDFRLQLFRDRAYAYFEAGKPALGVSDYSEIVKLDTAALASVQAKVEQAQLLEDRGNAFVRLCRPDEALADFKAAHDLDQGNTSLSNVLESTQAAVTPSNRISPPFFVYMWPYRGSEDIPKVVMGLEPQIVKWINGRAWATFIPKSEVRYHDARDVQLAQAIVDDLNKRGFPVQGPSLSAPVQTSSLASDSSLRRIELWIANNVSR